MIKCTTINVDGKYRKWEFESTVELARLWWSGESDFPFSDDPVTEFEIAGIPMYVNCFEDITHLLGIENMKGD